MCEPLQSTEAQDIASANAPEADPDTASNSQWSSDSMQRIESMVRSLEHKSMELYNQVGQMRTMYMHQNQVNSTALRCRRVAQDCWQWNRPMDLLDLGGPDRKDGGKLYE